MDSRVVVSNADQSVSDNVRTFLSIGHIPLRQLEESDPESFEAMVQLLSKLADNFLGNLLQKDWSESGVYVQNVILFGNDRERDRLHTYLVDKGNAFGRDLFGFSFDDDHVHVIHSCAFSSSQCKCRWKKEIPCGQLKPGYRFRSNLREWGRRNFANVAIYYYFQKRSKAKEAWIEGRRQRLEANCKYQLAFV